MPASQAWSASQTFDWSTCWPIGSWLQISPVFSLFCVRLFCWSFPPPFPMCWLPRQVLDATSNNDNYMLGLTNYHAELLSVGCPLLWTRGLLNYMHSQLATLFIVEWMWQWVYTFPHFEISYVLLLIVLIFSYWKLEIKNPSYNL